MLRSLVDTDKGPLVLLGLTYAHLARLRDGQPIDVPMAPMLAELGADERMRAAPLAQARVVIFAGESEEALAIELEHHGFAPPGTVRAAQEAAANRDTRIARR